MDQRVVVIEGPSPIVTWDEMKIHAKIEEETEKVYVQTLISAATAWLDGATGWLGRSIGLQVLEAKYSNWPCRTDDLPYGPVVEVLSVDYVDRNGTAQVLLPEDFASGSPFPDVRGNDGDVTIRYRAGYGSADDDGVWVAAPPAPLKVAVMMLVAQWYENREAAAVGVSVEKLPFAVEALVQPYRVYR
jgi:uncharacterized phiE125 gp8 family phage protein